MFRALDAPGNLLVEATFRNPNSELGQYWSHGFLLKSDGPNRAYWVGYKSTGIWRHFHRLGSGEQRGERNTHTKDIDLTPGALNLLQVVYAEGQGWVYINGAYQGSFSMATDTGGNRVAIYVSDKDLGTTRWEDFVVWRWDPTMYRDFPNADPDFVPTPAPTITPRPTHTPAPTVRPSVPLFGPVSGSILHDSEDGYLASFQGPSIQGDLMLEVTFEVPFAPNESHWNFGILFSGGVEVYHDIAILSKFGGSYVHWRRAGPDAEVRGGLAEDLHGLNFGKGEKNHIRLIVIGKEGWLYVNDRRVAIIPFGLGNLPNPDEVKLSINDIDAFGFEYDRGGKTRFEDFTVWKWHPSLFDLPKDD